jgi:hypothetical protein
MRASWVRAPSRRVSALVCANHCSHYRWQLYRGRGSCGEVKERRGGFCGLERLGAAEPERRGVAKGPPRWGRCRPPHSIKRPDCLRGLAPQSRFVAANAVKQGRINIGEAHETLGDGVGVRAWCTWRAHGSRQPFLVDTRIASPVRTRSDLVAVGLNVSLERRRLTGPASAALLARGQKFALNLKQAGFDRAGTPKSPQ